MNLELNDREREILVTLIDRRLHEIGPEIRHTDKRPYRHELQADQGALEHLKRQLQHLDVRQTA